MNDSEHFLCTLLDDFLAHDLTCDEAARFSAHCSICPRCRQQVEAQDRLRAHILAATDEVAPVPTALSQRIGVARSSARLRRTAAFVAAATVVFAVLGFWIRFRRDTEFPVGGVTSNVAMVAVDETPKPVHVVFPKSLIVLPAKTESPNVTFFWVYPGIGAPAAPARQPPPDSIERNDS